MPDTDWGAPLWEQYGLRKNPYFIQPLTKGTLRLFKGESRLQASREIVGHVTAGASPILLLQGGPGVGKTTLVNHAKLKLASSREYYVYPQRIEISASTTREDLAAELLAAITTSALKTNPSADWQQDARWSEAYETIADTWEQSELGGGVEFAGFGASLTRAQVRQLAKITPWETWKALVRNLLQALTNRREGFVVHINNIDAVSDENPRKVRQLLDEARELLIQPGIVSILCASPAFQSDVIGSRQRLLDVITTLNPVERLRPFEFIEAVRARYQHFLADEAAFIEPVHDDALQSLYNLFDGDMRNTFQVAVDAIVQSSLTQTETSTLEERGVLALVAAKLEAQYDQLVDSERKIVSYLLEHGESPSQGALKESIDSPQPTVSHATRRLENKRWIATSQQGTRLSYELTGYGKLLKKARELHLL